MQETENKLQAAAEEVDSDPTLRALMVSMSEKRRRFLFVSWDNTDPGAPSSLVSNAHPGEVGAMLRMLCEVFEQSEIEQAVELSPLVPSVKH